MSFLNNLTHIFKAAPVPKKRGKVLPKARKKKVVVSQTAFSTRQIEKMKAQVRELTFKAKNEAFQIKTEAAERARKIEREALETKERISKKEAEISRVTGALQEREKLLSERNKFLEKKLSEVEKIKEQQLAKLERAAGLTGEEAKKLILDAVEKKLTIDIARKIRESEEKAKEEADAKARELLVDAMYRGATDYVPEYTVSSVKLTDEDMKGRIIGREGRNIRTFEKCTGVDVDLDEEGVIRLSSFDSVRREVARQALEKLIVDGRIQPSRIEEVVAKTRKDVEKIMFRAGEDLCHQLKVYNLPRPVVAMLGRFKYRFSYGQNMIAHTLEETKIGIALAQEAGVDVNIVRLGCLLHDIGKVITEEEGSHVQVGADFLRKHNIPKLVLACVAQHHEDKPFTSSEAVLVYVADAISGSRPGARYEDYGEYVKRLEKLENLAKSFRGVEKAYAIQAGREVRVIVNPSKLTDAAATKLAHELKKKIKKELTYPGQVKITVIRETRATDVAK